MNFMRKIVNIIKQKQLSAKYHKEVISEKLQELNRVMDRNTQIMNVIREKVIEMYDDR